MTIEDQLRAASRAATPGPWKRIGQRLASIPAYRTVADCRYVNGVNDANALALSRNHIEALCDVVQQAREILVAAEGYASEAKAEGVWDTRTADGIIVARIIDKLQPVIHGLDATEKEPQDAD